MVDSSARDRVQNYPPSSDARIRHQHARREPERGNSCPACGGQPHQLADRERGDHASQGWRAYDQLWADERVLWADEPAEMEAVWRAISARDDKSHKLWSDDYMAAFAQVSDATLVTLDRKMPVRNPSVRVELLLR